MKHRIFINHLFIALLLPTLIISCQSNKTLTTNTTPADEDTLISRIAKGDMEGVLRSLESGESPDTVDAFGETALGTAAWKGSTDITTFLLLAGADPDKADLYGETPLHRALSAGHSEVAALLLSAGASDDVQDGMGRRPSERGSLPSQNTLDRMGKLFAATQDYYAKNGNLQESRHFLVWSAMPELTREKGEEWSSYTERSTTAKLSAWLALTDMAFPPEIPVPPTPKPINLVQDPWENNKEFETRVQKANTERAAVIADLQKQYQSEVEARNRQIVALNHLQAQRKQQMPDYRRSFALIAMSMLFPHTSFEKAELNQDTSQLFFSGVATKTDTLGTFETASADINLRKAALSTPEKLRLEVKPYATQTGEFGIESVEITFDGQTCRPNPHPEVPVSRPPAPLPSI